MPTHRTRAVEVDAFRWDGKRDVCDKGPGWITEMIQDGHARLRKNEYGTLRLLVNTERHGGFIVIVCFAGEYLLRFPDGRIEKCTPEEFEAGFEIIPRPGCGSCGNDVTQDPDGLKRNEPNPCMPCEDGSAWTPRRIPHVLDALRKAMERWPNQPLSSLLANVNSWASDEAIVQHFIQVAKGR